MLSALGLGFVLKARDEASETIEKVHEGLEKLEHAGHQAHHSLLTAGKTAALGLVGVGVAALGVGAGMFEFAEHAEKFSSAIRQAGVAAHATGEELEAFEEMAKNKSMDSLRGSAIETAQTLAELAKEGFNLKESGQALDGTLNLMRISMGALGAKDAAGLVNDTLGQFKMQAGQASELADKLAFAMQHFGFRAEELKGTMSGLAAGAQLTGASLDDTLIGVGLIKQVFPSATKAASAMNVAMQQLASTHTQKELLGIGVATKDAHGKMLPLLDVMRSLSEHTKGMNDAQLANKLATIGSARAAGGLSVIIDALKKGVMDTNGHLLTGGAALDFYRKQLTASAGSAKAMSEMLGDDMGGAITALRGALSNLGVAFGGMFEGGFKNAIQSFNLFIRGVTQLFTQGGFSGDVKDALDKHLGIKEFAVNVWMWIERIKNFFSNLGASFQESFAPFKPALDSLIEAFGFLGQALGLTGQGADDNAGKWDTMGNAGTKVGDILANVAGVAIPLIQSAILALSTAIEIVKENWHQFGGAITFVWGIVSNTVKMIAGLLSGNWKMAWDGFVDVVKNAALAMVHVLMGIVGFVAKSVDSIGGLFGKKWNHEGQIKDLAKEWEGNIKFGANELKAVVQGEPSPAKGAIEGQAKANAAASSTKEGSEGGSTEHHTHVSVHLDGEKVGEATAHARRGARARSFETVGPEGRL